MSDPLEGEVPIHSESDIVTARKVIRTAATALGFGVTDVTRIVTAASELARNVFRYAGSGTMRCHNLQQNESIGIEVTFVDKGPGIANVEQAMEPGYSTSGGLGLGLPGAKRLMDEIQVQSEVGKGTTITVRKWRRK
jgi:serine/threonine-protein kinase RsbT